MTRFDTVTFASDYGLVDESVGAVKSVLREQAPQATVIDLTHDLPPFDVRAASIALVRAAHSLVAGVVVAIVDPGVGTSRRVVAVEVGDGESVLIGPDNGVLAPVVALVGGATKAVVVKESAGSAGRFTYAPIAAAVCNGVPLEELGELIDPAELTPGVLSFAATKNGAIEADVIWVDRYGNVQLNVSADLVEGWDKVVVQSEQRTIARRVDAFANLKENEVGMLIDNNGLVSLVCNQKSAAEATLLMANDSAVLRSAIA